LELNSGKLLEAERLSFSLERSLGRVGKANVQTGRFFEILEDADKQWIVEESIAKSTQLYFDLRKEGFR